jgi:hypothetical protein
MPSCFLGADVDVHESTASNNCVNHRGESNQIFNRAKNL